MIRGLVSWLARSYLAILGIVLFFAAWHTAAITLQVLYLPTPFEVLRSFVLEWGSELFFTHAVPSLKRMALGYCFAVLFGVGIGILVGTSDFWADGLDPVLEFFRALPATLIIPVGIILLGIGDSMKVFVVAFGAMWPIFLNTVDGLKSTDKTRLDVARSFGLSRWDTTWRVSLPSAAPSIASGLRIGIGLAIIMIVVSEMVGASDGIGYYIAFAQRTFKIADMYSGMLLLGALGTVLNGAMVYFERRVLHWSLQNVE